MEDVFVEFGQGFLSGLSVIGMIFILSSQWQPGQIVYTAIVNFMTSICG